MSRRATYIVYGEGQGFEQTCKARGYAPLTDPPREGKNKRVVQQDRYENDRVTIDFTEVEHEH